MSAALLAGCTAAHRIPDDKLSDMGSILRIGETRREHLLERLGPAVDQYEAGRIDAFAMDCRQPTPRPTVPVSANCFLMVVYGRDGVVLRYSIVGVDRHEL